MKLILRGNIFPLTADQTGEGLSEEGKHCVHVREGVGMPGVTLQHGPAGGHVQSGRIYWVHSGVKVLGGGKSGKKSQQQQRRVEDSVSVRGVMGGNIKCGGGGGAAAISRSGTYE